MASGTQVKQTTQAQKIFAQGLAMGKPATVAYKLAHPNIKMKGASLAVTAGKSKKTKAVQDELARLLAEPILQPLILLPCPEYLDYNKLIEHAVGIMVRLTNHSDPLVQLHAAKWIFDYGQDLKTKRYAKQHPGKTSEQILAELRGIYSKNLPSPKLIVEDAKPEVVIDAEPETDQAEEEDTGWTPDEQSEEESQETSQA